MSSLSQEWPGIHYPAGAAGLFAIVTPSGTRFNYAAMTSFLGKCILGLLGLFLVAVTASFATVLLQTYREHRHFSEREASVRADLNALREQREYKERYLRLMLEDPEFLERVVREKLGYVRPDETVYLFESGGR